MTAIDGNNKMIDLLLYSLGSPLLLKCDATVSGKLGYSINKYNHIKIISKIEIHSKIKSMDPNWTFIFGLLVFKIIYFFPSQKL